MKPKSILLILSIALAVLTVAFLFSAATLAAEPDRDTAASDARDRQVAPPVEGGTESTAGTFWASEWTDIGTSETRAFDHNLGGDVEDYSVQVWFRDTDAGGYGVNNRAYGGLEDNGTWSGVFWRSLTGTSITVGRQPADTVADQVRVWIWLSQTSLEYCTAWTAIGQGDTVNVTHGLNGDVNDYIVKLWFRDPGSPNGVHQIYYGGAEDSDDGLFGAYWYGLDTNQVKVYRNIDDTDADEFRLCVSVPDPPDWSSGWRSINAGDTLTLTHPLGGNINRYIVLMDFKAVAKDSAPQAPIGIHNYAYGGDASSVLVEDLEYRGANWQNLTNHSIKVYRWADDPYADQVRVRIWLRRVSVYLPIVLRGDS